AEMRNVEDWHSLSKEHRLGGLGKLINHPPTETLRQAARAKPPQRISSRAESRASSRQRNLPRKASKTRLREEASKEMRQTEILRHNLISAADPLAKKEAPTESPREGSWQIHKLQLKPKSMPRTPRERPLR